MDAKKYVDNQSEDKLIFVNPYIRRRKAIDFQSAPIPYTPVYKTVNQRDINNVRTLTERFYITVYNIFKKLFGAEMHKQKKYSFSELCARVNCIRINNERRI